MATNRNAPEGYEPSRAALRRMYGTRRIDASAPQSALDDTPSGRQRALAGIGLSSRQVQAEENARWRSAFPEPPAAQVRPLSMLSNRRPPNTTLDAIQQAQANGAAYGSFPVPQYGGSVSFSRPSLMPETPVADASDLGGFSPSSSFTPLSFFKPRPRPSILTGAQNWIAQI